MWTIIKIDYKKINFLKKDFKVRLGDDVNIYSPKLIINIQNKNKYRKKEFSLMGDYLFCFHDKFKNPQMIKSLKNSRGLKYFLNGFVQSQSEIKEFISRCKESENHEGYLTEKFYKLYSNTSYKFSSGPFVNTIFKIIDFQKNKINILIGGLKTTIARNKFSFTPV